MFSLITVWSFFILSLVLFGNLFRLGLQKYPTNKMDGLGFMMVGGLMLFTVVGPAAYVIKEIRRKTPQTAYPETLRLQEGDW
ncbi:MAG TPA: hypothetical protein VMS31_12035 [Pyrinomonadaceae bacterium]|nr:hypothetical protein [Pyrinomonadaceae bacterium]